MTRSRFTLCSAALILLAVVNACTRATEPTTAPVAQVSDAAIADALPDSTADAADAAVDAIDAAEASAVDAGRVTLDEFPESAAPNKWLVASQGNSPANAESGSVSGASTLVLFTNDPGGGGACADNSACAASQCVANQCRQRVKQKSPRQDLGFGEYSWRVYLPAPNPAGAQVSVAAFLYADDLHELDFECGPGSSATRANATLPHANGTVGPAQPGELVCQITSQANPAKSGLLAVQAGAFHTFSLTLAAAANDHYAANFRIDGKSVTTVDLSYGPNDLCELYVPGRKCTFQPFVSVENLAFIGDVYPTSRNEAHFDWFRAVE